MKKKKTKNLSPFDKKANINPVNYCMLKVISFFVFFVLCSVELKTSKESPPYSYAMTSNVYLPPTRGAFTTSLVMKSDNLAHHPKRASKVLLHASSLMHLRH